MSGRLSKKTRKTKDIENLYLTTNARRKTEVEYFPCVYIEADIDFNDIRTGYRGAETLVRALKIHERQAFPGWIEEIVQDANIDKIKKTPPRAARLCPLPKFLDAEFINAIKTRYIEYLTRTWKKILYRNTELNIYSGAGESREEFAARCREQFLGQMREELNQLRVIFNRMQEQLKEKYLGIEEVELPDPVFFAPETNDRDIYSRYAERVAALFMDAALSDADAGADVPMMDKNSELEERFIALMDEARRKIALLRGNYEKKADSIEEYIVNPNIKNISCERNCILWMPREG